VTGLELGERYPGLEGSAFHRTFGNGISDHFCAQSGSTASPRFASGPRTAVRAPASDFFEPRANGRQSLLGFDMSTDSILRAAMDRASRHWTARRVRHATEGRALKQSANRISFSTYRSIASRPSVETVEQRRSALIGLVFGPFRLDQLLQHVMMATTPWWLSTSIRRREQSGGVDLSVYRGRWDDRFSSTESLQVAGREWDITMRSFDEPVGLVSPAARRTLLFGLLLSMLLFLITSGQLRAWETAARHEAELRASERALRESELELHQTVARERDARTHIEAADRAKDEFLATLSHELRTPLNTVLGWLAMLRTSSMREDQRAHALEVIERNARLQAQLIEDLLDVSYRHKVIESHPSRGPDRRRSRVDPADRRAKGRRSTRPHARNGSDLGRSSRVQQIVWNLLSNAVKFTAGGQSRGAHRGRPLRSAVRP
jgi:CHASE1-domain containing sensor protein